MKFGIHVGFGPKTLNLKFFIVWMIGFLGMGSEFFENLEKKKGAPNFKTPYDLLN